MITVQTALGAASAAMLLLVKFRGRSIAAEAAPTRMGCFLAPSIGYPRAARHTIKM
jgi:hypothetical protein